MMKVVFIEDEQPWLPHPRAKDVKIKYLIPKSELNENTICLLVKIPRGAEVPTHSHECQSDILYPLYGRFKMWIEGIGEIEVKKGMIVRIPRGVKHKVYDVQEDSLIINVFSTSLLLDVT